MSQSNRKSILILDPERDIGDLFARALEARKDCKCYQASTEEEALDLLKDISFSLILVDIGMAMMADFSLLKKIRRISPESILVIAAYLHQKQHIRQAVALGASGYILKPIKIDSFRKQIDDFWTGSASAIL